MKEQIGNEQEQTLRPTQEEKAPPADAEESVGYAPPEKSPRVPPTIHGSTGQQIVTLAIMGLAIVLMMLAVWIGEPA